MIKNEAINEKEMTLLIANLLSVKAIFAFPRTIVETSANAAWLEVIYMAFLAWALMEISFLTYRISGRKSIIDISERVGGKPLKIAVSMLVVLALSVNFVTEIRMFSESVKLILLPRTEIEYILILLAVTIAIGQKSGISAIATVNAIFFPVCLLFLGIIVFFLYKSYNVNNLFPILGNGTKSILKGGIQNLSCFGDILAINLLLPHLKDIGIPKKSGRKALLIATITMFLICLCYVLCYAYPLSKEYLLPVYQLSKMIRAGEYFQRFEAFFEFIWEISQLLYSSIYIFIIAETLTKAFDLKDRNAVSYGIIAIITLIASEPISIAEVLKNSQIADFATIPIVYLLPIFIPLLYARKKMAIRKAEK
ncbi:MAG: endospore germination permease [Clostridia bacterium]|nr:endospore germination permease [Clostridia bacterium]